MSKQIFINIPVRDLEKTKSFFSNLGFSFNPQFTDEKAACMIIEDNYSYVMLLTEEFFKTFTPKEVSDASKTTEVILSISVDGREQVDEMVAKAVDSGATIVKDSQDYGWMYQHSFQDLDGHLWEVVYVNVAAMNEAFANTGAGEQA